MPQDNLRPPGSALFEEIGRVCAGRPVDEVISVALNVVLNAIRQNTAGRAEAEARLNELHGRAMDLLMSHYDPVTDRRRSVVPFDQTISVSHVRFQSIFVRLGKNGHT